MKFSKEEKEIIRTIVCHEHRRVSMAMVFTCCRFFEHRGIGVVCEGQSQMVFLKKDIHPDWFHNEGVGYITSLFNLIKSLEENKYIQYVGDASRQPLVVGALQSEYHRMNTIRVNGNEIVVYDGRQKGWYGADGHEKYWMYETGRDLQFHISNNFYAPYCVSQELKDLVKNNFKTDEEIRFRKQQCSNWIGIGVAILIGILGIIF